jgi:hypothetical protein
MGFFKRRPTSSSEQVDAFTRALQNKTDAFGRNIDSAVDGANKRLAQSGVDPLPPTPSAEMSRFTATQELERLKREAADQAALEDLRRRMDLP